MPLPTSENAKTRLYAITKTTSSAGGRSGALMMSVAMETLLPPCSRMARNICVDSSTVAFLLFARWRRSSWIMDIAPVVVHVSCELSGGQLNIVGIGYMLVNVQFLLQQDFKLSKYIVEMMKIRSEVRSPLPHASNLFSVACLYFHGLYNGADNFNHYVWFNKIVKCVNT